MPAAVCIGRLAAAHANQSREKRNKHFDNGLEYNGHHAIYKMTMPRE